MKSSAHLSDDLSQPGVAHHQPAAGSDAVGFVLELVGLHFIEVLETVNTANHHSGATHTGFLRNSFSPQHHSSSCCVSEATYIVALRMSE